MRRYYANAYSTLETAVFARPEWEWEYGKYREYQRYSQKIRTIRVKITH